jgi:large subunit ribosomal protein L29|tara:strand:+ start:1265 stop:1471 length:207 start_codon:yes stop_codon:yes gene_type:complete
MAVKIRMKGIRGMNEKDLRDRIEQMRTELMKLRVESSKGTLRKESGNLKPVRKNVARLLTRLNEMKKK